MNEISLKNPIDVQRRLKIKDGASSYRKTFYDRAIKSAY